MQVVADERQGRPLRAVDYLVDELDGQDGRQRSHAGDSASKQTETTFLLSRPDRWVRTEKEGRGWRGQVRVRGNRLLASYDHDSAIARPSRPRLPARVWHTCSSTHLASLAVGDPALLPGHASGPIGRPAGGGRKPSSSSKSSSFSRPPERVCCGEGPCDKIRRWSIGCNTTA